MLFKGNIYCLFIATHDGYFNLGFYSFYQVDSILAGRAYTVSGIPASVNRPGVHSAGGCVEISYL